MFDIGLPEFEIINRETNENEDYIYYVTVKNSPTECPECGSTHIVKHKKHERKVRDLNEREHRVGIVIQGNRYQCKECGNTFGDDLQSIDKSGRLTKRLITQIRLDCCTATFKKIAEKYGISLPSVKRIFEEYAEELNESYKPYAPKVLGIDEVHLHSSYCGVFVDVTGQRVIDITENRNLKTVKDFLANLPDKNKIKCVTIDMWRNYKDAVNEVLPGVPVVIDKFHVVKILNNGLEEIRRSLRKEMDKESRTSLKNKRFLFVAANEGLVARQAKQLEEILEVYPQFKTPYYLKEAFRDIYLYAKTRADAEKQYEEWVQANKDEDCHAFDSFINTVENWHTEIFNYFDYPYTNAETESLNNTIREVDRAGRGYTFPMLRAKVLLRHRKEKKGKFKF